MDYQQKIELAREERNRYKRQWYAKKERIREYNRIHRRKNAKLLREKEIERLARKELERKAEKKNAV